MSSRAVVVSGSIRPYDCSRLMDQESDEDAMRYDEWTRNLFLEMLYR